MKKLIIAAMVAFSIGTTMASEYMVYDFLMTVKTTKAKGKVSTSCGNDYVWRDSASQKIRGVIAGCGCPSILANGSCQNALVLLWNDTTKQQITNFTFSTWIVQRIGKTGLVAEHVAKIECSDFEVTLAGLGTYKQEHALIAGKFAGIAGAPYLTTAASCNACCGFNTPETTDQSTAIAPCEDGLCTIADTGDITPFFGTYTLKYNAIKSKQVSRFGILPKYLGAPAFVNIDLGFFD